jgi:hypothetical protein
MSASASGRHGAEPGIVVQGLQRAREEDVQDGQPRGGTGLHGEMEELLRQASDD